MDPLNTLLLQASKNIPNLNKERISAAYEFAKKAHKGQKRASGEDYIIHPLEVASILLTLHPDEESIIAAILHDVVEDTPVTLEEIEKEFGHTVAELAKGLEKFSAIHIKDEDQQINNWRKMFLSMAKDIRVVFIKLCDRLHNMRTLHFLPPHKQGRIARETLEIYAPIATRLGMYHIKTELEDLCFKVLHPQEYKNLEIQLGKQKQKREKIVGDSKKTLITILQKEHFDIEIEGRVKHFYSIYRKLLRYNENNIHTITDIFALRIITNNPEDCYHILGVIHKHFHPLTSRFKDYIAVPKPNGYRSLHTTVVGLVTKHKTRPIEIQIRSKEMHKEAVMGAAAHWQYKEKGTSKKIVTLPDDKMMWIKGLVALGKTLPSNQEFSQNLSVDVFQDRIFVFTPEGDIKDLPKKATVIDFAYAIHTQIGHTCSGALINGKNKPLNTELQNGEVIQILTKKNQTPNPYWISLAVTSHAKQCIKGWLRSQDKDQMIKKGKELLNKYLQRIGKEELDTNLSLLKNWKKKYLSMNEREKLLERMGSGYLTVTNFVSHLFPQKKEKRKKDMNISTPQTTGKHIPSIIVEGDAGIKTQIAECCHPSPEDKITGYITHKHIIMIHKSSCKNIVKNQKERIVKSRWTTDITGKEVQLSICFFDRKNIIKEIITILSSFDINILKMDCSLDESNYQGSMHIFFEIIEEDTLHQILDHVECIENISQVKLLHY